MGTANVNRQWVRNVRQTPSIKPGVGGQVFEGGHVSSPIVPSMNELWRPSGKSTGCFGRSLPGGGSSHRPRSGG
jgi:hypothetical protein